ncbi:TPA: hypothetical protein QCX75_005056 [Bacillus mycoides]|uniref:hypothetical protein n=1 Tax=Bacillus TaxID=1386 RepID=UPI000BF1F3B3|nr:hypothetical protein [Bacillus wiedmannii]PEL83272.1 hypothetical protein CN626_29630 [Bacillus wiedmannii]HDR7636173.1 hypothetical protein [Bacillus mycoides]
MAKITVRESKEIVTTFIHACLDRGLSTNKAFDLFNEILILIEEKRCTEEMWFEKIEIAVAEANNKEGVTL